jgi:hypothetical protein
MRVLIVEDDFSLAELFKGELLRLIKADEVTIVSSRDEALEVLTTKSYDVAVVDLAIPTRAGGLDQDTSHGLRVLASLEESHKGTIRIAHTALGQQRLVDPLYERQQPENLFGSGPEAMFMHRPKGSSGGFDEVMRIAEALARLQAIAIGDPEFAAKLPGVDARIIRSFAVSRGANAVSGSILHSGKSSARVYRLRLYQHATEQQAVVAKCDSYEKIAAEHELFDRYILNQLENGTYAQIVNRDPLVAMNQAGVFYGLASPDSEELDSLLQSDPKTAANVISLIRAAECRWARAVVHKQMPIRDIRRMLMSDERAQRVRHLLNFDIEGFENLECSVLVSRQHGDLHPGNILVCRGEPLIIDFACAGEYPACLDPLTLELALAFNSSLAGHGWPRSDAVRRWALSAEYFATSPYQAYLHACREWAVEMTAAVGPKALFASGYAYLLRQLQYSDVDKDLCLAFLEVMIRGVKTS